MISGKRRNPWALMDGENLDNWQTLKAEGSLFPGRETQEAGQMQDKDYV